MNLAFGINLDSMKLYNGRRSFYLGIRIGSRHVFLSRWDTVRVDPKPRQRFLHRGSVMTWYCGAF